VNACLDALAHRQRRPATVSLTAPDGQEAPAPERALAVASAEDDAVKMRVHRARHAVQRAMHGQPACAG